LIYNCGVSACSGAAAQYLGAGDGCLLGGRVGREDIARLEVEAGDGALLAGDQVLLKL
jgi:hypothetical protein